jgi:TRAP-type C4-dicarboxylate transport system permease small subunit
MHKFVRIADAVLSPIDAVFKWLIASGLLVMTGVLFANVVGRTVFNISFIGAPTIGRFLMIWITFIGAYVVVRFADHIAIDMLSEKVSKKSQRVLSVIANSVATALSAYVAWLGYLFTVTRFTFGQIDVMLHISAGYFYLPIPIGFSLMTVGFMIKAIKAILNEPVQPTDSVTPKIGNIS